MGRCEGIVYGAWGIVLDLVLGDVSLGGWVSGWV